MLLPLFYFFPICGQGFGIWNLTEYIRSSTCRGSYLANNPGPMDKSLLDNAAKGVPLTEGSWFEIVRQRTALRRAGHFGLQTLEPKRTPGAKHRGRSLMSHPKA